MLSSRTRVLRLLQMRLPPDAPTRCRRCWRLYHGAAAPRVAGGARAAAPKSRSSRRGPCCWLKRPHARLASTRPPDVAITALGHGLPAEPAIFARKLDLGDLLDLGLAVHEVAAVDRDR